MGAADIMVPHKQRETADCAIACLATYLGVTYEDALRAVSDVDPKLKGRKGLWKHQIESASIILGHPLHFTSQVDLESDYGILKVDDHVVVLRNGLIFEPGYAAVWEADDYLNYTEHRPVGIFLAEEDED